MNRIKMPRGGSRKLLRNFTANIDMRFDESVLSEGAPSRIDGFAVESGSLTDGYGVEEAEAFAGKRGRTAWQFTRYDRDARAYKTCDMYCDVNGYVHYNYGDGWQVLQLVHFASTPSAITYRLYGEDSLIMTSPTDKMFVWDGVNDPVYVADSPFITSMAMHFERMFATTPGESNTVYYSDDLDPTNWTASLTEGGYVMLLDERGRLLKVLDFLNYVYIFREFGISRLTAYADQSEFRVSNLYVSGGRIYGDSVCACGDVVMMLASDGLQAFDGYGVSRRLKQVRFLSSPNASAVYADGKYYLTASTAREGENDTLVVYDIKSSTFSITRIGIKRLCKCGELVIAVMEDDRIGKITKNGRVFDQPIQKVWESGDLDWGNADVKNVAYLTVRSETDGTLTLVADGEERSYGLAPGINRIKPMLSGRIFRFRITTTSPHANVSRLCYKVRGG
ncbi:MAG: hypothetical protein IKM44_01490 [Clostridia bacterium]|nr:hypothetical protein [Clostridia bacterium]